MNEKKNKPGLFWGAVSGILMILTHLGFYVSGSTAQFGLTWELTTALLLLVCCLAAAWAQRRNQGGIASFRDLLRPAMTTLVTGLAIFTLYSWVYYNVIDLGAAAKEKQHVIESTIKMDEMAQRTPAEIAEDRKYLVSLDFTLTPWQAIWKLLQSIIRYFVIAVLAAFVFRRKARATSNN